MDNQKSNEGSARNLGQGLGNSMGKDQTAGNQGKDQIAGGNKVGTGSVGSVGNASTSSMGSSGAGSSGSMGSMGSSGSSSVNLSGSAGSSSSSGSSQMSQDSGQSGIASVVNPQQMHRTIDKAAQAAQPMVERLANSAHASVDKMTDMLNGASQGIGQRQQQLTDAASQWMESSREYIRQKPATAMMIALGAGFILARLLGGNRREY